MPKEEAVVWREKLGHPVFPLLDLDTFPLPCSCLHGLPDKEFLPPRQGVTLTAVKEKTHDPWWVEVRQERT